MTSPQEVLAFLVRVSDNGYVPIPWETFADGTYQPAITFKNRIDSPTKNELVEVWGCHQSADWSARPGHDVVVLDLENKEGKNGLQDLKDLIGEQTVDFLWPSCAKTKTKNGGYHLYFRTGGYAFTSGYLSYGSGGIEIKHRCPVHLGISDRYECVGDGIPPKSQDLPMIPKAIIDQFEVRRKEKKAGGLIADVIPNGAHHEAIVSMAGKLRNAGLSHREMVVALTTFVEDRFTGEHTYDADYIEKLTTDYMDKGRAESLFDRALGGDYFSGAACIALLKSMRPPHIACPEWGSIFDRLPESVKPTFNWINRWNSVDQPVYALQGILSLAATCIGNGATYTGSKPLIYSISVGPTSSGKQRPLVAAKMILVGLDLANRIGSSDLNSHLGLLRMLERSESLLLAIDEFSKMISSLKERANNAAANSIRSYILQLFNGDHFCSSPTKEEKGITIQNPSLSIMGFTQPSTMWSSIEESMIADGFLGRFLYFKGDQQSMPSIPTGLEGTQPKMVPESVIKYWRRIVETADQPGVVDAVNAPETLTLRNGLHELWANEVIRGPTILRAERGKYPELVNKLALIYAVLDCGEVDSGLTVTPEAVQWAHDVVMRTYYDMETDRKKYHNVNIYAHNRRRVIECIAKGYTISAINAELHDIPPKFREEILTDLLKHRQIRQLSNPQTGEKSWWVSDQIKKQIEEAK